MAIITMEAPAGALFDPATRTYIQEGDAPANAWGGQFFYDDEADEYFQASSSGPNGTSSSAFGGTYTVGSDGDTGLYIDRKGQVGPITFSSPTIFNNANPAVTVGTDPQTGQSFYIYNGSQGLQDDTLGIGVGAVVGKVVGTLLTGTQPGGLYNNIAVRNEYLSKVAQIEAKIDRTLPLKDQARQAFELRNALKSEARSAMTDKIKVSELNSTAPIQTWDQIVDHALNKGHSGDDVWRYILDSSLRTNPGVNRRLGVKAGGG